MLLLLLLELLELLELAPAPAPVPDSSLLVGAACRPVPLLPPPAPCLARASASSSAASSLASSSACRAAFSAAMASRATAQGSHTASHWEAALRRTAGTPGQRVQSLAFGAAVAVGAEEEGAASAELAAAAAVAAVAPALAAWLAAKAALCSPLRLSAAALCSAFSLARLSSSCAWSPPMARSSHSMPCAMLASGWPLEGILATPLTTQCLLRARASRRRPSSSAPLVSAVGRSDLFAKLQAGLSAYKRACERAHVCVCVRRGG